MACGSPSCPLPPSALSLSPACYARVLSRDQGGRESPSIENYILARRRSHTPAFLSPSRNDVRFSLRVVRGDDPTDSPASGTDAADAVFSWQIASQNMAFKRVYCRAKDAGRVSWRSQRRVFYNGLVM